MATVSFTPGRTSMTLGHRMNFSTLSAPITEVPGGLYPLRLMAYDLDEFRIMAGWPHPVPPYDVRGVGVVSVFGERTDYRPAPIDVTTGAAARWIADEDHYSSTDLAWYPVARSLDLVWRTSPEYAPALITDYEYRVGTERFYRKALNFDSDTANHMWLNLRGVLPALGYTVIMVMSPNSTFGNNIDVPYNGLWCPGGPTPTPAGDGTFTETATDFYSVTMQGYYTYLQTDQHARARGVSIASALGKNAPLYLVLSLASPTTSMYAAAGPSSHRKVSLPAGATVKPVDSGIVLGRSTGDINHTADMALLELGVYSAVLSDSEVRHEIALLSQIYGDDT